MSDVVSLDDYRGDRKARLRETLALYGADGDRSKLVMRLWEAVEVVRADRAAVVWIDEYGPGMVHVHCLLDLGAETPRRAFAIEPLRRAWEEGIPGLLDESELTHSGDRILPEGPRSLSAVALGSDGVRAWFLVADSRSPRSPLSEMAVESLMFLAGECASIVLHQDLAGSAESADAATASFEEVRRDRFSGWPVLQDLEGHESDPERGGAITVRFLITRLLRTLVDDDFVLDAESLRHQIHAIRTEIGATPDAGRERRSWTRVLDAIESDDHREMTRAVLELAHVAENQGHLHGARELDRIAYEVATAARDVEAAVDAARFLGRVCRRLGSWDDSERWYEIGREVARACELPREEALVLSGLGNTLRVRGNHPGAREIYEQVLLMGVELEDDGLRARAGHNLMLVEKHAGRTDEALRHGWSAVQLYPRDFDALAALTDLGDVFLRSGELASAEAAFEVVAARSEILDARIIALDALAHIAARRGDLAEFQRRLERLGSEDVEGAAIEVRGQVLLVRGRSFLALGETGVAERWFRRCLAFAEERGLNQLLFEAEEALAALEDGKGGELLDRRELPEPAPTTMAELREPLSSLRAAPPGAL